jgi:hypothetical protein
MQFEEYTLSRNFRAPRVDSDNRRPFSNFRQFTKGQKVKGYMPTSNIDIKFIVTQDNFAIPESAIENIAPKETAAPAGTKPTDTANLTELQKKLAEIKSTNVLSSVITKSRQSANGLVAGAAIGAIISFVFKKPFFGSVVICGVAGGLLAYKVAKPGSNFLKPKVDEIDQKTTK